MISDRRGCCLTLDEAAVPEITGHHHDAGQQGRQRRGREPPMRVQESGKDDAEAIERYLDREHPQHGDGDGVCSRVEVTHQPTRCGFGQKRQQQSDGHQDGQYPGQPFGGCAISSAHVSRDQGHRDRRENTASGHLDQHIGQGIHALIDLANTVGAHRFGKDQDPAQSGRAGQQGDPGDQPGGSGDPHHGPT